MPGGSLLTPAPLTQSKAAVAALTAKLLDEGEHSMVRHEAAEALGAINEPCCEATLRSHVDDASQEARPWRPRGAPAARALPCRHRAHRLPALSLRTPDGLLQVADTCRLALGRITYWRERRAAAAEQGPAPGPGGEQRGSKKEQFSAAASGAAAHGGADDGAGAGGSPFLSVDPVPPAEEGIPLEVLREILSDESADMFERYRALFGLRNRAAEALADTLGAVLRGSRSALLKHEARGRKEP